MCPRYTNGEESPHIQNTQLTLNDIKEIFPPDFIRHIGRMCFCGGYGDPIVARDLIPIIKYLRSINKTLYVEVHTNGSARREEWWVELAEVIGSDKKMGVVKFALDGLRDTNHIYRRNTDWDVIMRNVKAYIGAGGKAHWNFIVFKHNEHQLELAKIIAKEMGFIKLNMKVSVRFDNKPTFPVIVNGKHEFDLEPPKQEQRLIPDAQNFTKPKPAGFHIPVQPNIKCYARKENSIYLSAQGLIYPCCWIGQGHMEGDPDIIINPDDIDPTKRSIEDIVNDQVFQTVENSWSTGSIGRCVQICTSPEEK